MSGSTVEAPSITTHTHSAGAILRFILIALTAFLTVVDLFATQAIGTFFAQACPRYRPDAALLRSSPDAAKKVQAMARAGSPIGLCMR